MNLPNKLTISRIVMAFVIIIILLGGSYTSSIFGLEIPKLFVNESIVIDMKYVIAGIIFIVASITDFLDGYIARKNNLVTDFGKLTDAIADKVLVDSVLIILSSQGRLHPVIPVVIVTRDIVIDSIRMLAATKGTATLMVGIVLTLFNNLPFELLNIDIATFLLLVATVLCIISGIQYINMNKNLVKSK